MDAFKWNHFIVKDKEFGYSIKDFKNNQNLSSQNKKIQIHSDSRVDKYI